MTIIKTDVNKYKIVQAAGRGPSGPAGGPTDILTALTALAAAQSGSPHGVYATTAALAAALPTGDTHVYVVSADGHWYYWNGTAWTDGGLYQSAGIADDSVPFAKMGVIERNIIQMAQRDIANIMGTVVDFALSPASGYIAKATGIETASASWRRTGFVPVRATSVINKNSTGMVNSVSAAASIAFYDAAKTYLGYYNHNTLAAFSVTAGDVYANAAYVRACFAATSTTTLTVSEPFPGSGRLLPDILQILNSSVIYDIFTVGNITNEYINQSGVAVGGSNWRTTDYIPCVDGQTFIYTGTGHDTLVSSVSLWDVNKEFLESLVIGARVENQLVTVDNASAAYVRASAATTASYSFYGHNRGTITPKTLSYLAPAQAYALQDEPLYMYARGIIADRSVDVAWNISQSNPDVCKITPTDTDPIPVKLRAIRDDLSTLEIADFNVLVTGTPTSPAAARNIICLGDSLTLAINSIEGAYPNELCRRLTGTGTALLAGALSPAALSLSNIYFRGTLGDQPVKHEGRGGWAANDYLNSASVGEVSNAFWNPTTEEFDLDYYLTENGFDSGSIGTGVDATGTNLTIVLLLGWNDVYTSTAEASAANLATLIDKIRVSKSACDIIVVGLNPPPQVNFKAFTGERFVSEREIFEAAIKQFGDAYRTMCAGKTNVDFLQLSHVFNPEIGYPTTTSAVSLRSAGTLTGASDHVHPAATGYAMLADALFYKLLYDYCRGV